MHLDVYRLQFPSLHSTPRSIFTPLYGPHYQVFAPYVVGCLVYCGLINNVFYPIGCQMLEMLLQLFVGLRGYGRGYWALSVFLGT